MKKTIKNQLLEMKAEGKFHSILNCISWLYDTGKYKLSDILDISKEIFGSNTVNIDTTNITNEKTLFFINNINDCELKYYSEYPNLILFVKNDKELFYLDLKKEEFVCDYYKIWKVFITEYGFNYYEIEVVIKGILETHLKLMGYTPLRTVIGHTSKINGLYTA
jgi:hypothetical protein